MKLKSKKDKKNLLYKVCRSQIKNLKIDCAESIYQTDRVSEGSLEFIEEICKVIGYCNSKDE